jgi:amino acid transporter
MNDTRRPVHARSVGLLGATGVGIGAIVGGGVLVLVGAAFAATGPSAIAAFALNGVIAVLTAMTFAEMSTAFPESGGAYTFAKKVLSVRAAFGVGWVLWFAYIVAAVLYARGFAEFGVAMLRELWHLTGSDAPSWSVGRRSVLALAVFACGGYALNLAARAAGGGQWATIGKLVVFAVLIAGGVWAFARRPVVDLGHHFSPFFANGASGLLEAMGITFIAVQGFDLIAAIAGEVENPGRTIPRAMLLSLGVALAIYLPLLLIVTTVGAGVGPREGITAMSVRNPETVMADAARNFLGPAGYWLVMIAAILSTLSALGASLLAASRVAHTMATDRTLPRVLATLHTVRATPVMATYASFLAAVAILFMIPDLAAAGAAAGLIFLVSFALAHWTAYLARRRSTEPVGTFRTPWFPLIPVVGGVACAAMAVYQGVAVPAAGAITAVWLGLGGMLYVALFAQRAEVVDAAAEGQDPALARLRGRTPLVLVPVRNPESAQALVAVASALAPREVGRVLLLSVMTRPEHPDADATRASLERTQVVLGEALQAALANGHSPEGLITAAPAPWEEIGRVARVHRCESLLVGLSELGRLGEGHLEGLLNRVECDVVVLRAPMGWQLEAARRIFVPIGGRATHDELRARLLGSLERAVHAEIHFLRVLDADAEDSACEDAERELYRLAEEETTRRPIVHVVRSSDVSRSVAELVNDDDLVILGLQRQGKRKLFGRVALMIAGSTRCAAIMISRRS